MCYWLDVTAAVTFSLLNEVVILYIKTQVKSVIMNYICTTMVRVKRRCDTTFIVPSLSDGSAMCIIS